MRRSKKEPRVSDEALQSREVADRMHAQAVATFTVAQTLGRKLEKVRSENHIAAAIDARKVA